LLAIVAAGYVIFCAAATVRVRGAALVWLVAAAILAFGWVRYPPAAWWVDRRALPSVTISVPANSRFALMPPFQPLTYDGSGSGADPDTRAINGNIAPINEYLATYPADAALARYFYRNDVKDLQNLSVSEIINRPWLSQDVGSLTAQTPGSAAGSEAPHSFYYKHLDYLPELTTCDISRVGSLNNRVGDCNVFFGDAAQIVGATVPAAWRRLPTVNLVKGSPYTNDPMSDWVPVAPLFRTRPELAQGLGGAVTVSTRSLAVASGRDALVYARGALLSVNGRRLARDTAGYRWIRIPENTPRVRCQGLCIVVAEVAAVPKVPLNPPPRKWRRATFLQITPWLAIAIVPPGPVAVLRYNVRYNAGWVAVQRMRRLPHFRLDTTVNGWLLEPRPIAERTVLIDITAAIQTIMEILGLAWCLALLTHWFIFRLRRIVTHT
jgi:hypothetical protein